MCERLQGWLVVPGLSQLKLERALSERKTRVRTTVCVYVAMCFYVYTRFHEERNRLMRVVLDACVRHVCLYLTLYNVYE